MSVLTGSMRRDKSEVYSGFKRRNKSEDYSGFKSEMGEVKEIVEELGEAGLSGHDYSYEKLLRQFNQYSYYETDEEEQDGAKVGEDNVVGPLLPLKEQLEKDKDNESLRRWKEHLLGSLDMESIGERLEQDVKILSLSILSPERPDLILPIPFAPKSRVSSFTLKEGITVILKNLTCDVNDKFHSVKKRF